MPEKPETEKTRTRRRRECVRILPPLAEGDRLELKALRPEQKFTQPPPRFTEATLVKELEENGIGRPSTYASIIGVLQDRDYANKVEGKFKPTALGLIIIDLLIKSFDDILDVEYTRSLEEDLDRIEQGRPTTRARSRRSTRNSRKTQKPARRCRTSRKASRPRRSAIAAARGWSSRSASSAVRGLQRLSGLHEHPRAREEQSPAPTDETQDETCENCGKPMVVKRGRFGQFFACTGYPECKTTRKIISSGGSMKAAKPDQILEEKCPKCDSFLVIKQGRFGEFTACTNYPNCKYVKMKTTGVLCPKDGGDIVERKSRRGKAFYGCANYPDCDFTLWKRPIRKPVQTAARRSCSRRSRRRRGASSSAARTTAHMCGTHRWKSRYLPRDWGLGIWD